MKDIEGNNVRISTPVYTKVKKYTFKKGYRIGKFFESGALEKMERDILFDRENKKSKNSGI